MASERIRRDSLFVDMLQPKMRQRLHSISGHLNPSYCSSGEIQPEKQQFSDDGNVSPHAEFRGNTWCSQIPETIHAAGYHKKTSLGDLYWLPSMRPERRTHLNELPLSELDRFRRFSLHTGAPLSLPSATLVSERINRMQMLEQYLNERGAELVVPTSAPKSSFFRLAFHNNLIKELKKVSNTSGNHWLYWYLRILFKYTGLKHAALTLLLICYALLGGVIFQQIEYSNERQVTIDAAASVMAEIAAFAASLNQSAFASHINLTAEVTEFYKRALTADGFTSNLDRLNDDSATWSFAAATFYAMTLLSTIGYGTIACKTVLGKVITVIYVTVGLPLMLIVVRDLGLVIFLALQKGYGRFRKTRLVLTSKSSHEDVALSFPLPLGILLVYLYLGVITLIVYFFDEEEAHAGSSGLSLGNCFYFAFISLTTIGLGDVMPCNIHYSPMFALFFLSGLALISTVNTATYARIERKYFNAMGTLERVLVELEVDEERKRKEQQDCEEQQSKQRAVNRPPIFHHLIEIVRLAALVIPNLDDKLDEAMVKSYEALHEIDSRKSSLTTPRGIIGDSSTINAIERNGWTSLRSSVRSKYNTLQDYLAGKRSNSTTRLASNSPRPPISVIVDNAARECLKETERDKRFTVCPVQDGSS